MVDEKRGAEKMTYAAIPYDAVTGLSYSRSAHPRAKSGIALGVVSLGIGLLVGFLAKGKKHWFTIEFEGVADHPENYHYLRLDKGNYRRILQAVEAATGPKRCRPKAARSFWAPMCPFFITMKISTFSRVIRI